MKRMCYSRLVIKYTRFLGPACWSIIQWREHCARQKEVTKKALFLQRQMWPKKATFISLFFVLCTASLLLLLVSCLHLGYMHLLPSFQLAEDDPQHIDDLLKTYVYTIILGFLEIWNVLSTPTWRRVVHKTNITSAYPDGCRWTDPKTWE